MSLLVKILLLLVRSVAAEVYFNPSESVVIICGETNLTCNTTTTGVLSWSLTTGEELTYYTHSEFPGTQADLADNIAVKLTAKNNSTLTSVATIKGPSEALNGTVILCADSEVVRSKVLLIPALLVPSQLKFKAQNFTSATLNWIAPIGASQCVHNYTVLVQGNNSVFNITTTATAINVTGLIRGEEYIVTVSNAFGNETIRMTLEVADAVTDLKAEQIFEFKLNISWKQPYSSRPPVIHYVVTHNVTGSKNNSSQHTTNDTNIIINGTQRGYVYCIQVVAVNTLGCSEPKSTISTLVLNLTTMTPTAETPTDSSSIVMVYIIVSTLCAIILMFGCCLVSTIVILRKVKIFNPEIQTNKTQPVNRNAMHIYDILDQENHLYFLDSQEISSTDHQASFIPIPPPPPPIPPLSPSPLALSASMKPKSESLPLRERARSRTPSPPPSPPFQPPSQSPPPPPPPPPLPPLISPPPMMPPPSSPPPSPPSSPCIAVVHEYDKPLPVSLSRPGTTRK